MLSMGLIDVACRPFKALTNCSKTDVGLEGGWRPEHMTCQGSLRVLGLSSLRGSHSGGIFLLLWDLLLCPRLWCGPQLCPLWGAQLCWKVWRNSFLPAGQEDTPALLPCRRPGRMDDGQKERPCGGSRRNRRRAKSVEPGRSRTCSLLIRSQARCPLRHWPRPLAIPVPMAACPHPSFCRTSAVPIMKTPNNIQCNIKQ